MKRVFFVFLSVLLLSGSVFAHSGGTDSQGGHRDSTTGEYHFHHGFPAHQHVNGICPYEDEPQNQLVDKNRLDSESSDIQDPGTVFLSWFWGLYGICASVFVVQQAIKHRTKSISAFVFNGLLSLIQFFAMTLYAPLFLVSWISDKFHSSGHSMKSLGSSYINFVKRHCTLIKVTALTLLIISSFVGYGLAEKTGNLWFLSPFAVLLVCAFWFLIKEKLS